MTIRKRRKRQEKEEKERVKKQKKKYKKCPRCWKENIPERTHCQHCGTSLL